MVQWLARLTHTQIVAGSIPDTSEERGKLFIGPTSLRTRQLLEDTPQGMVHSFLPLPVYHVFATFIYIRS